MSAIWTMKVGIFCGSGTSNGRSELLQNDRVLVLRIGIYYWSAVINGYCASNFLNSNVLNQHELWAVIWALVQYYMSLEYLPWTPSCRGSVYCAFVTLRWWGRWWALWILAPVGIAWEIPHVKICWAPEFLGWNTCDCFWTAKHLSPAWLVNGNTVVPLQYWETA